LKGLPGAMIGAYVSHRPDLGPQFLGMALVDLYPEMDVARGYPNGAGLASSSGTTQSTTCAGMARIGWALPVFGPAVAVPYAEISAVSASVDGWTESGGPFPAGIGAFNVTATTLRLGSQLRVPVSDSVTLFGSADFADLLSSSLPTVEDSLLVADCNGAAPLLAFCGITGTGAALTPGIGSRQAPTPGLSFRPPRSRRFRRVIWGKWKASQQPTRRRSASARRFERARNIA
jgi:hypothetical protein